MSSEEKGRSQGSVEPGPVTGTTTRVSAQAPSAWGAARDALASVHNLDALLRSAKLPYRTILDLLTELRSSAAVLRDVFERAQAGDSTWAAVGAYGAERVTALAALLDATAASSQGRQELARSARSLAEELEAAADLLSLLERATSPIPRR